jgi:sugar lactone lactonase YvrE
LSVRIIEAREEIGHGAYEVAEGPIWDDRFEVLRWVDLNHGTVHGHDLAGEPLPVIDLGQHVGFVVPTGESQLLAGVRDGFALVDVEDGSWVLRQDLELDRGHMRLNDGKADQQGRLWAGTMGIENPGPEGTLYRLDRDWSVHPELTGLTIANGLGWSPDGRTMYFTDTAWGRIDAFDYDPDTGDVANRRVFVEVAADLGSPDGFTVDEEGCLWVALWLGGAIHRFTPAGELDTIVRIPAVEASSCVFGGPGREDLFITSAAYQLDERQLADHPRSGRIFTCRPGVTGMRTDSFVPAG